MTLFLTRTKIIGIGHFFKTVILVHAWIVALGLIVIFREKRAGVVDELAGESETAAFGDESWREKLSFILLFDFVDEIFDSHELLLFDVGVLTCFCESDL